MKTTIEKLPGDTEGVSYELTVFRFKGSSKKAPTAYIQAALHAGELPGVVAIHALMPKLRAAEAEGRILGDITIVPAANPVGRAQYHFGDVQGRFHLGTRTNFNRDFPLLDRPDKSALPPATHAATVDVRLKRLLVELSIGHDIVLDLHCDDEGVPYLYVPAQLWPAMQDCAAAMGVEAVILWEGGSGAAFEEAAIHPWLQLPREKAGLDRRVVTTVEYRGLRDVESAYAKSDAEGIYRLLVTRGVIADEKAAKPRKFAGHRRADRQCRACRHAARRRHPVPRRAGPARPERREARDHRSLARRRRRRDRPLRAAGRLHPHPQFAPLRPRRRRYHQAGRRGAQRQGESRRAGGLRLRMNPVAPKTVRRYGKCHDDAFERDELWWWAS